MVQWPRRRRRLGAGIYEVTRGAEHRPCFELTSNPAFMLDLVVLFITLQLPHVPRHLHTPMHMVLWIHPHLSIFQKVCLRGIAVALRAIGNLFTHRPVYLFCPTSSIVCSCYCIDFFYYYLYLLAFSALISFLLFFSICCVNTELVRILYSYSIILCAAHRISTHTCCLIT